MLPCRESCLLSRRFTSKITWLSWEQLRPNGGAHKVPSELTRLHKVSYDLTKLGEDSSDLTRLNKALSDLTLCSDERQTRLHAVSCQIRRDFMMSLVRRDFVKSLLYPVSLSAVLSGWTAILVLSTILVMWFYSITVVLLYYCDTILVQQYYSITSVLSKFVCTLIELCWVVFSQGVLKG